jgi:hypothetical protein
MSPGWGLDTKTYWPYWLTERQSQCDFHFDSERAVSSERESAISVGTQQKQLAVSIQREQSVQETQVKFSQRGSWEHRRTSSCLIVRVIYVWLVKCNNEAA